MNTRIMLALLAITALPALAIELSDVVVYRGIDGNLTQASQRGLRILRKAARDNGQIQIWILFDMGFESNPALRTPEVERAEAAVKASLIEAVVVPLRRVVALVVPTPDGLESAPGCMVHVTERGLVALVRDSRVKHVSYHP